MKATDPLEDGDRALINACHQRPARLSRLPEQIGRHLREASGAGEPALYSPEAA